MKIMIELLSVLALATKQVKQGRFSKSAVYMTYTVYGSMCHREVRAKIVRGERDRGSSTAIGSIDTGRGSDDRSTDFECGLWSCGYYEGRYGRYGMVAYLEMSFF